MSDDEEAFTAFYDRTAAGLWRYLRRLAGDDALAEDLVQESYVKYLAASVDRDAAERQRQAYLYRIATNLLRDRWRRAKREEGWLAQLFSGPAKSGPEAGAGATAKPAAGRADLRMDLDAVLGTLRQRDRALLWLAYVEGRDHREIAEILGLRSASVRVLLFRARKRLAAELERRGFTARPEESQTVLRQGEARS